MMVSNDNGLNQYLAQVLNQLQSWLLQGEVQKVVIVITGANSGETLERWVERTSTTAREHGRNIVAPAIALEASLESSGGTCWVMYCTAIV